MDVGIVIVVLDWGIMGGGGIGSILLLFKLGI